MPTVRHTQAAFSGGEASPAIYSRVDLDRYRTMLKTCRNGWIKPTGGWSNRSGMKMMARVKNNLTTGARVVKFVFSNSQAYALEFGDYYVRFYTDRAQILSGGTPYEVATPYPIADVPSLNFEQSADTIYITHNKYQQRTLSRLADANWSLELYASLDGPFLDENTDTTSTLTLSAASGTGVLITAAKDVFTSTQVGGLWKITHYVAAEKESTQFTVASGVVSSHSSSWIGRIFNFLYSNGAFTNTPVSSGSGVGSSAAIPCFTTWRIITHGTWTGSFQVEKSSDNGETWTALQAFSSADDFNANTSGTEDPSINLTPFLVRVNMTSFTSGTANIDLSSNSHYNDGIVKITGFTDTKHVTVTVLQSVVPLQASFTWSEGAWSDYRGWPAISRFFLDRLVFACSKFQPMTEWMSMASNYVSFRRNSISLLASDGITTSLTSRQLNAINGMLSFKRLLFLTSGATWSVGPLSGSALGPTSVDQQIEEYNGSAGVAPVTIGNEAIFVQNYGKVVKNTVFQLQYNGFSGSDINILSRHLTEHRSIVEMDYQQNPDSIVWMACDDGVLLGLTYMKEQDVVAWHRHDTQGLVESLCVIPGDGYDELWMVVKRPNGRFIEVMEKRIDDDVRNSYFVDNGVSFAEDKAITGVSIGATVSVTVVGHGYSDDDYVDINNVLGCSVLNTDRTITGINGYQYRIKVTDADHIRLYEPVSGAVIDGSLWSAYVSGGVCGKGYTSFSGLDWLEGVEISILADGWVLPRQTVVGGTITLDDYYSVVQVGIPYDSDFETLNVEVPTQVQAGQPGSTQGRNVKIPSVIFRVVNSRGGKIGPSEFNQYGQTALYEAFIPDRTSLGLCPPLESRDRKLPLGGKYSDGGRVFYRQSDPLPVTINAVIPTVNVGGEMSGGSKG